MGVINEHTADKYIELKEEFFTKERIIKLKKLMTDPKERELHEKLKQKNISELYKKSVSLINKIESGKLYGDKKEKAEYILLHYVSAMDRLWDKKGPADIITRGE